MTALYALSNTYVSAHKIPSIFKPFGNKLFKKIRHKPPIDGSLKILVI